MKHIKKTMDYKNKDSDIKVEKKMRIFQDSKNKK